MECDCSKWQENIEKYDLAFWTLGELRLQTAAVKVHRDLPWIKWQDLIDLEATGFSCFNKEQI